MKTLITIAATLALCVAPLTSHAQGPPSGDVQVEDGLITGILTGVNSLEGTVVLDGVSYQVPGNVADLTRFAAGDDVLLGFVRDDTGARLVTSLRKQELG